MSGPGFREWGARVSNWGRWGPGDELGTLNWITPESVVAAAGLVRAGAVVSLGLPLDANGPQAPGSARFNPVHVMTRTSAAPPEPGGFQWMDDLLIIYPQGATQVDALSHVAYDGLLYNGVPAAAVGAGGAARHGVEALRGGIIGRGVLADLPRHLGVDRLAPNHVVTPAEVDSCLASQGVEPAAGDVLLLRTGWIRELRDQGAAAYLAREPGIDLPMTAWLAEHRTAFLAADTWGIEVAPATSGDTMPVHCVLVRDMGMPLGEIFNLEALSEACARHTRWEFLFAAHPLQITGGVGSPLEPKAIL